MNTKYAVYSRDNTEGVLILLDYTIKKVTYTPRGVKFFSLDEKRLPDYESIVKFISIHRSKLGMIVYVPKLSLTDAKARFDIPDPMRDLVLSGKAHTSQSDPYAALLNTYLPGLYK